MSSKKFAFDEYYIKLDGETFPDYMAKFVNDYCLDENYFQKYTKKDFIKWLWAKIHCEQEELHRETVKHYGLFSKYNVEPYCIEVSSQDWEILINTFIRVDNTTRKIIWRDKHYTGMYQDIMYYSMYGDLKLALHSTVENDKTTKLLLYTRIYVENYIGYPTWKYIGEDC